MLPKTKASGGSPQLSLKRPASSPNEGMNKKSNATGASGACTSRPVAESLSFAAATTAGLSLTTTTVANASGSTITTTTTLDNNRQPVGDKSVFKTPEPEGGFRDEIVVSIDTLDDEPYKGTITVKEAVREIFIGAMEFEKESLASVSIGYNKGRIVTFKLVNLFDIDTLASVEEFTFNRQGQRKDGSLFEQKLGCKIRGIRRPNHGSFTSYNDGQTRWVKIEGCEYRVEKEELKTWMNYLGNVITEITEDRVNLDDESSGDEETPGFTVGTGIYSVKMRLTSELPQFVPICGKRIRLYYKDIPKVCTNCFGRHPRKGCTEDKVPWVKYVSDFMLTHDYIPKECYGKWGKIVDEWRTSNGLQELPETLPGTESNPNNTEERPPLGDHAKANTKPTPTAPTTEGVAHYSPGALGLEVYGGTPKLHDESGTDPGNVGLALRKLRTLGINTTAVTLPKQPTQTGETTTKTKKQPTGASTRRRKNSL